MTARTKASHLRGRYLAGNPWLAAYLGVTDAALSSIRLFSRRGHATPARIERILIGVGGHLGDAIIATSAIELIRRARPRAELGILTPSWCAPVFAGDARLTWTHTVDHWRLNRARGGFTEGVHRYRQTADEAIREIRGVGYDAAFDLYPYYPNMAGVFWRAGIPLRAGFSSGGRGAFYTHALDWIDDRVHVAEKQGRLVRSLLPDAPAELPRTTLMQPTACPDLVASPYVVLHPGGGARTKDWPLDRWRSLAQDIRARGIGVVFTGAGAGERMRCDQLARDVPGSTSLADALDWPALTRLVAGASVVVSVDTSIAHLAAAVRTPNVVLYSGINPISEWRPLNHPDVPLSTLTEPVPCAPCFRGSGCATMACVRGVAMDRVAAEVHRILGLSA